MKRTAVLAFAWMILFAGPSAAEKTDWVKVTTWDGREITLGEYGFYSCSTWDRLSDYEFDRNEVAVVYGGGVTEFPLKRIRSIRQDPPVFTEHFRNLEIELVDGLMFRAETLRGVTGIAGMDRVGMVHIPGRAIKNIEFVRE
ncbi:MAG: hypothetical protein ABIK65_00050 [Candidatus Eisenbacteria bacterium]